MSASDCHKAVEDLHLRNYWKEALMINLQPPKVKSSFESELAEWYQKVILRATAIIEGWEETTGIMHTCKSHCNNCCSQLIEIYDFELIAIFEYVKANNLEYILDSAISAAELIEVVFHDTQVQDHFFLQNETLKYRMKYRELSIPCIFLKDNICSIYPVRPTSCANYYSYGPREDCRKKEQMPKHCMSLGSIEDWIVNQMTAFFEYNSEKLPHYFDPFSLRFMPVAIRDCLAEL